MYPRTEDSTKTRLRIRPKNTTIRELNLTEDQIREALKVMASPQSRQMRHVKMKEILKGNSCVVCGGIPQVEVIYHHAGISRKERYCFGHKKLVYERTEPKTQQELAEEYNCVAVNSISGVG